MPHANVLAHKSIANDLGLIGQWLDVRGWTYERFWREDFPVIPKADALISLGSLDSVASGHCASWAPSEVTMLRQWVDEGHTYLGVCFGAQILATALGGKVERRPRFHRAVKEIPWTDGSTRGPWVFWHEDAITSAGMGEVVSEIPNAIAAFHSGNAWGLQAHVELDAGGVENVGRSVGAPPDVWAPLVSELQRRSAEVKAATFSLLDCILAHEDSGRDGA